MTPHGSVARHSDAYKLGGLLMFLSAGVIATALAFEFVGGYAPCWLCGVQRYAYYAAIPLAFAALVLTSAEQEKAAALILLFVACAFLANSGIGLYQAGAEWGFWPGPETCSGAQTMTRQAGDLLSELGATRVVRCDVAAWRDPVVGLSFAGWNVLASFGLFVIGLKAAFAAADGR
ncbi:MAG: disulfide bond formation protein B [Hyphomicrobiaceae bacterium]|nr:disulfide bond formation protein B [Hyphomicrobiaceae bacterium]